MACGVKFDRRRPTAARPVFCVAIAIGFAAGSPAFGQGPSHAVVQPLPPPALTDLNAALGDLSHNPRDYGAMLRAGWASLALNDTKAALGFFQRAEAGGPSFGEAKAGEASAMLRLKDPVSAVKLFAEAEAGGTPMARFAGDRGLALDLVGKNVAAQQYYRQALAQKDDPEIVQRLALSQAISGDQRDSEATLLPLLQQRDLAAYRTRAFALAILGQGEQAVSIAETMLPAELSNRMAPYLRYMPRLTRAQQAAAANLGDFPPASEIGRDDPKIAALAATNPAPQLAQSGPDSRLVPSGPPLGRSDGGTGDRRQRRKEQAQTRDDKKARSSHVSVTYAPLPQVSSADATAAPPPPRVHAAVQPASAPQPSGELPPVPGAAPEPVAVASLNQGPSVGPAVAAFERPSVADATPPGAGPRTPERVSLADAFADFATPTPVNAAAGAVDITRVRPAHETPKPKAKPKPPANPSRVWVQVATGRNVKPLAFDWHRLQREGGALLARRDAYTARWGRTRRLLIGPYKSDDDAQDAIRALKKKRINSFEFTSDEGEEVAPLE